MDRAKAKSMTRSIQTVAAVLALAAIAAATIPFTAKAEPAGAAPVAAAEPPKPVEPPAPKVEIDVPLMAVALNAVSGPVKNQPTEPPPGGPGGEPEPRPVTGLASWRYLGAISSNASKRAIVHFNEGQHLLAEGQRINPDAQPGVPANPAAEVEIVEIAPTYIKVKQGEVETQIDIAPRQRAALNVLDPSAARGAAPGNPAMNNLMTAGSRTASSGAVMGAGAQMNEGTAQRRMRELERRRDDAKMRGDEKTAAAIDADMATVSKEAGGKDVKGEKSEKGVK